MAVELASAYVSVVPSMRGVGKSLRQQIGPAAFAKASRGSGAAVAKQTTVEMASALNKSKGLVTKASAALEKARIREADAVGKVRVAESALATARGKYAAGSTQVIRAEERVASARRAMRTASAQVATATRTLGVAQDAAATASSRLAAAQTTASKGLGRFATGSGRVSKTLTAMQGGLSRVSSGARTMGSGFVTASAKIGQSLRVGVASPLGSIAAQAGGLLAAVGLGSLGSTAVRVAVDLDNTNRALTGLYSSGEDAGDMMARIRRLASNSPIDVKSFTSAAKQLAYMGLKGKDAEQVLKNISAAVVASGGGSEKMGQASSAMLKIVNSGKVYADQLNQISEAGVPIFSGLAKHFNTNIENVRDMVSKGKVGLEDVLSVVKNGTGKTYQQMIAGAENVQKGVGAQFNILKNKINLALGDAVGPALNKVGQSFGPIGNAVQKGLGALPGILTRLKASMDENGVTAALVQIKDNLQTIGTSAAPVFKGAIAGIVATFSAFIKALAPVTGAVAKFFGWMSSEHAGVLRTIGVAIGAIAASTWILSGAMQAMAILQSIVRFLGIYKALSFAVSVATKVWAATQWLLNAAMSANPIGLIILAIVALAAALVIAYKKSETFRKIVQGIGSALKTAALAVWGAMKAIWSAITGAIGAVVGFVRTHWRALITIVLGPLRLLISLVTKYWTQIKSAIATAIGAVWTVIKTAMKGIYLAFVVPLKVMWAIGAAIFRLLVGAVKWAFGIIASWVMSKLTYVKNVFLIWFKGLKAAWTGFWTTIKRALAKIFGPIVAWVKTKIAQIKLGFQVWFRWLRAAWQAIWTRVKAVITKVFGPIVAWVKTKLAQIKLGFQIWIGWIKAAWSKLWTGVKNTATTLMNQVKSVLKNALNGMKSAFRTGVDAIGKAWDKIKAKAKTPVRFVINTVVNDWLIGGYNKLAGLFGVKKVAEVHPKGFATGGYTGNGGKYEPKGVVHGGEFVLRKEATRSLMRQGVDLNYANRFGALPGYAKGGLVPFGKWLRKRGFRVGEHPAFGGVHPVHTKGSYHYKAGAIDVNYGPGGQSRAEMAAFDKIIRSGIARAFGLRSIWRYPGHYNHAHFDVGGGPDLGMRQGKYKGPPTGFEGSGGGLGLLNPFSGLVKKLMDKIPGKGKFAKDAVVGAGKKAISGAIDWFKEKSASLFDFGGGGSAVPNKGSVQEIVQNTAKQFGWGSGKQWNALSWLIQHESSWNPNAKNPSSSAYGLFQFLDSTWKSVGGRKTSNPAKQALYGMRYIKQRYKSPLGAKSFWQRHHWYDQGGMLEPGPTLAMNKTGKPEAVLTHDQFKNLETIANHGSGPLIGQVVLQSTEPRDALDELEFRLRKMRRGGRYA